MEHPIVITSSNQIENRNDKSVRLPFSFIDGYAFSPSYVVNGANPAAKIKHIIQCAKTMSFSDGYC